MSVGTPTTQVPRNAFNTKTKITKDEALKLNHHNFKMPSNGRIERNTK